MRATVVVALVTVGCSSQETAPGFDAGLSPCEHGPFVFCPVNAPEAGAEGVCPLDDQRYQRYLTRLPQGRPYPVDCVANFVGDRDEKGNCRTDAVCKCLVTVITTSVDAGADAGPSTVTTRSAPAWNCAP
jgi:hypothetical protein